MVNTKCRTFDSPLDSPFCFPPPSAGVRSILAADVEPTIIRKLTKRHQLSYAELVGPAPVKYFVSHFWGTSFRHFVETLECHAKQVDSGNENWEELPYWIP